MANQYINKVAYGLSEPLPNMAPRPIQAKRAPTTRDTGYLPGTLWVNLSTSLVYVLALVANNSATWQLIESSGGAGVFSSLTVTPGPISLTGTTTINTSGSAVTTIGTGGTGAVNIGNATGNTAVTGALAATTTITAGTGLIATTGGITATGTSNINTSGSAVTTIGTGGTGAVNIGNATGNTAVTGALVASTALRGATVYASGDLGGVAANTSLSNVDVPVAGGSGAFTITSATGAGTATNAGFIKMYVGTTPIFIPYYTVTA